MATDDDSSFDVHAEPDDDDCSMSPEDSEHSDQQQQQRHVAIVFQAIFVTPPSTPGEPWTFVPGDPRKTALAATWSPDCRLDPELLARYVMLQRVGASPMMYQQPRMVIHLPGDRRIDVAAGGRTLTANFDFLDATYMRQYVGDPCEEVHRWFVDQKKFVDSPTATWVLNLFVRLGDDAGRPLPSEVGLVWHSRRLRPFARRSLFYTFGEFVREFSDKLTPPPFYTNNVADGPMLLGQPFVVFEKCTAV